MSLPEPLTPADCDLQDFPFMPLQVARLRDSDLAAEVHPEAAWYAVMLWSAAWHQLPAASLPNNDIVLMKLAGLGRDTKTFKKHREGMLRGFVECADGRLYHPVVAEQALASWEGKLQQRWRSECARIKKANQRNGTDLPSPTYEEFLSGASPTTPAPCPPSVPGDTSECPSGHRLQETGTGTGTGILKEESFALSAAKAAEAAIGSAEGSGKPPPKRTERAYPDDFEAAWKVYPHFRGRSSKPNALVAWRKLPQAERDAMIAAIERFKPKVREVCGDKGAPDMARWLRDGKHLNWLDPAAEAVSVNPEAWPFMVAMWRRGDPWPPTAGPAPDRPDTLVPAHLLRDDALLPMLPEVH